LSWVAVAAAGAAVIGAGASYYGNQQSSRAAERGGQSAIDEQRRQFDTLLGLGQPYQTTGVGANNALARLFGLPYQSGQTSVSPSGSSGSTGGSGSGGSSDRRQLNPIGGDFAPALPNIPGLPNAIQPGGRFDILSGGIDRLLGGGGGDRARFDSGPRPEGVGSQRFEPSELIAMRNRGMSVDDIIKQGFFSPMEGQRAIGYLTSAGFTPEDVARLQGRQPQVQNQMVMPSGPDMSSFFTSPGYEFRRGEGQRDIQNVFAARGAGQSGNALRALTDFNQNLASGEFGNYVNTLMGLSGRGQQQAQSTGQAAMQTGTNVGNLLAGMGNARASGIAGQYQGINDAAQSGAQNWLFSRYLRQPVGG
jgi:hypothetical protein